MNVLVAISTRHGSTFEIGDRIAGVLRHAGLDVDVMNVRDVTGLDQYQTVVIGSAVYMGQWTPDAQAFLDQYRGELVAVPVWVFSSGPIGPQPLNGETPPGHLAACAAIHPVGDNVFSGVVDRKKLGVMEKLLLRIMHASEGDYRDWAEIDSWADSISRAVTGADAVQRDDSASLPTREQV